MKFLKIGLSIFALFVTFFMGVMLGVTPTPDHDKVKTVTVVKEVEVEVIKEVPVEVPVEVIKEVPVETKVPTVYPDACFKAMENAQDIKTNVSAVSGTMGQQLDLATK